MELQEALDYQRDYEKNVRKAAAFIKEYMPQTPKFSITLGSGLGDLANEIKDPTIIPYEDIPKFPITTVKGHDGKLVIGGLEGVPVIGLKGRKHYYEVADQPMNLGILQVVFPIHVLAELGVGNYFVSNAAGGLNLTYQVGDIMIIKSHMSQIPNPLLGRVLDLETITGEKLQRFQPMNGAYDPELRAMLREATVDHQGHIHEGVYYALTGTTYETEAECIAFRKGLKVDTVGMSTVPEVIVARNRGMTTVGFSCITNKIAEDGTNATNHEEVERILESQEVKDRLSSTVKNFFRIIKEKN